MTPIESKFDQLFSAISSEAFLSGQLLAGDVASYITTYAPKDGEAIPTQISGLIRRLDANGIRVLEINLYKLMLKILESRNLLDRVFQMETKMGKKKLLDSLVTTLDVQRVLLPQIEQTKESDTLGYQAMFITGIGEVFPLIRAHSVLNNLHGICAKLPVVAFFPGEYDGYRLKLFGELQDSNHYRAFTLDNYAG